MRPRKGPTMTAKKGRGLLMVWADVPADKEAEFNRWYNEEHLAEIDAEWNEWYNTVYVPNYEKVPGVIRGRRHRAVVGTPTYLTFYEFEHPRVSETPEWHAQRNAVAASERMRGYMHHAPGSPGVYTKTFEIKK